MGFPCSFAARAVIFAAVLAAAPAFGQTTTSTQITPGHDAAITPSKITPAPKDSTQGKILDSALAPKTRQTLQDAMNSAASTNAPAQAAPAGK